MDASMEVSTHRRVSFHPLVPVGRSWRRMRRRPRATQVRTALIFIAIVVGLVAWLVLAPTGTRRVVDLASVVLAKPRLLLLDEPTAGIAQREAEAFIPLLQRIHQVADTTIILVEHDVPLVFELCSKVVVMELGRVVAAGPPEVIRADSKALAAYLGASDEALMASGPIGEGGGADRRQGG